MVTGAAHVPDRGDVVWLDFDPQTGREQAGHRPALVLTPAAYNARSSLALCCPITNQAKGYPFEVPIVAAAGSNVTGVVLCDQVAAKDWRARNATKKGTVTLQCLQDVSAKIKTLLP